MALKGPKLPPVVARNKAEWRLPTALTELTARARLNFKSYALIKWVIRMNSVYFACTSCKNYIDAGYRGALNALFPEKLGSIDIHAIHEISEDDIINNSDYWKLEHSHPYYSEVLPRVRTFLTKHRDHRLIFSDLDGLLYPRDEEFESLRWLDEGDMYELPGKALIMEPRYFIEHPKLQYRQWSSVKAYCAAHDCVWNYGDSPGYPTDAIAQEIFETALQDFLKRSRC